MGDFRRRKIVDQKPLFTSRGQLVTSGFTVIAAINRRGGTISGSSARDDYVVASSVHGGKASPICAGGVEQKPCSVEAFGRFAHPTRCPTAYPLLQSTSDMAGV